MNTTFKNTLNKQSKMNTLIYTRRNLNEVSHAECEAKRYQVPFLKSFV